MTKIKKSKIYDTSKTTKVRVLLQNRSKSALPGVSCRGREPGPIKKPFSVFKFRNLENELSVWVRSWELKTRVLNPKKNEI